MAPNIAPIIARLSLLCFTIFSVSISFSWAQTNETTPPSFSEKLNEDSTIKKDPFKGTYLDSIFTEPQPDPDTKKRLMRHHYGYIERDHTLQEDIKNQALLYGLAWAFYPITQPSILKGNGGFDTYGKNFGKLVFDKDEPFWNWFVHPISGSQLYLYYRADGYSRIDSFKMALITSALFEFTVEIFTEPASVQDLYQTPVLGSILGLGIENFSMYLLNTGHPVSIFFGHLINPATLLPIYQGKTLIVPTINSKEPEKSGVMIQSMVSF